MTAFHYYILFVALGIVVTALAANTESFVRWLIKAWLYIAFAWLIIKIAQMQP